MPKSEIPADMSFETVSRDFSISTSVNAISRFACASWHIFIWKQDKSVFRFFMESWENRSLGARLRTRKVRCRDAALPAPLLSAFEMLVGLGTVGALPQTPQGTLSLDPARGRRKGTKSPLDPFSRLSWSRFHASSACSFLALRLSPCLLPQLSMKNHFSYAFTFPKLSGISTTKRGWHDKSPADTRSSGSSSAFSGYRRRKSATGAIGHDSFAAVL